MLSLDFLDDVRRMNKRQVRRWLPRFVCLVAVYDTLPYANLLLSHLQNRIMYASQA